MVGLLFFVIRTKKIFFFNFKKNILNCKFVICNKDNVFTQ